ncbi:MAG: hypothetical protein WDZ59_16215 [Pirellulales bacterium]
MHAYELIEIAGLAALHGPALVDGETPLPADAVADYWQASRLRLNRWHSALDHFRQAAVGNLAPTRHENWLAVEPVAREILTSEILTRVWAALATARDRAAGRRDVAPVARTIFAGHAQARLAALRLILGSPAVPCSAANYVNRLRVRCERWTDLLIGCIARAGIAAPFSFQPRQHQLPGYLLSHHSDGDAPDRLTEQLFSAIEQSFGDESDRPATANADLNARIGASLLACLLPEMCRRPRRAALDCERRLSFTAREAEAMLDQLLAIDGDATSQQLDAAG